MESSGSEMMPPMRMSSSIPDRFAQHGSSPVDPSLPDLSEIVTAATQTAALASYGLIPMHPWQ